MYYLQFILKTDKLNTGGRCHGSSPAEP